MPVPFGFSIGDFIAVGELAQKLARALDESGGATADFKSLSKLLLSLNRALQTASVVLLRPASNRDSSFDTAPFNGIRHELECCKRLMEEFLADSRKYTEDILKAEGWGVIYLWRKIAWTLYKTEDVRNLQAKLQGHLYAFQLYSTTIIHQSIARTEQRTIENSEICHRTRLEIRETFAIVKNLNESLPKNIGYPWECGWAKDQIPIRFEDALGKLVLLPPVLCRSKEVFHDVLEIMFKDLPGRTWVTEKEYEVIDTRGSFIGDSDWTSQVLPGMQIAMSLLIMVVSKSITKTETTTNECPQCGTSSAGATPERGFVKCCHCNLSYRAIDIERLVELPEDLQGAHPKPAFVASGPIELEDFGHFRQVVSSVRPGQQRKLVILVYDPLVQQCWGPFMDFRREATYGGYSQVMEFFMVSLGIKDLSMELEDFVMELGIMSIPMLAFWGGNTWETAVVGFDNVPSILEAHAPKHIPRDVPQAAPTVVATDIPGYIHQGVQEFLEVNDFYEMIRNLWANHVVVVNFYDHLVPLCYKATAAFNDVANDSFYSNMAVGFFSINIAKGNLGAIMEGLGVTRIPTVAFFTATGPQGAPGTNASSTRMEGTNFTASSSSLGKRAQVGGRGEFVFRRTHHHREVLRYRPKSRLTKDDLNTPLAITDVITKIKSAIQLTSKVTFQSYCKVVNGGRTTLEELL